MLISNFKNIRYAYIFISFLFCIIYSEDSELTYNINNKDIIELNSYYIIERIKFSKSSDNPLDYLLGIFEASNYSTFSDALPIAMIKEDDISNSIDNELSININVPYSYKYIRYNPPNSNGKDISDIKIFGHAYIDGENLSGKYLFKPTNLPLMIINTKNSVEPSSLEYYISSSIIIINENENKIQFNETASIRLRGHSTSTRPKKPYKIKFDKKQTILGFAKDYKKFAILANHYDKSLIRNILAFEISKNVGLKFTPRCDPVDVIVNGNFRGNYFVCDQIEVKKGRVDIEEISDDDISGGYLIEIDQRAIKEKKYFLTDKGIVGEIKYPDEDDITKEQDNYIKQYLNQFEKSTYNGDFKYIDLPSFYRYFIVQEFCGDIDSMLSSFHCHKKKGDQKLYFGPVWDYDLSFDNDGRLIPTNEKTKFTLYYGATAGSTRDFFINLLKTGNIMDNIEKTWMELRANGLDFDNLKIFIDSQKELLKESANLNSLKWYGSKIGEGEKDFSDSVDVVINYVEKRFDSLTKLIKDFDFGGILKINYYILIFLFIIL